MMVPDVKYMRPGSPYQMMQNDMDQPLAETASQTEGPRKRGKLGTKLRPKHRITVGRHRAVLRPHMS
jgi:hypothetical protein